MLSDLKKWLDENTHCLSIIHKNESGDSLTVDIDDEKNVARFTAWDDNSCMLEIMNIDDGQYLINKRYQTSGLDKVIQRFMNFQRLLA